MSNATHGTTRSYITGYILSLIFTAISYYLVVNKSVSGRALLGAIIGFALLQMLIQIIFFLHLGRGPKPLYNVIFFAATTVGVLVIVGGSIFIMDRLHYNMTPTDTAKQLAEGEAIYQVGGKKTGACHGVNANHQVTIVGGQINPVHTTARLCDTLTFIKGTSTTDWITFGSYSQSSTYAGLTELTSKEGGVSTVTLNQAGNYQFYDHLNPQATGSFTVRP